MTLIAILFSVILINSRMLMIQILTIVSKFSNHLILLRGGGSGKPLLRGEVNLPPLVTSVLLVGKWKKHKNWKYFLMWTFRFSIHECGLKRKIQIALSVNFCFIQNHSVTRIVAFSYLLGTLPYKINQNWIIFFTIWNT